MSYAYTHLKHKTIIDIKIFMLSYNELIQLLKLITNICLFGSPIGVTKLITCIYYKAYTGTSYLILAQHLYLQQTYSYSERILIAFGSYTYNILILIRNLYL